MTTKIEKRKGGRSKYSDALKRKVALDYLTGSGSMKAVAARYKLPSRFTVESMVKWFKEKGGEENDATCEPDTTPSVGETELERRCRELEAELERERTRSLAFETMIEVAEEELGIQIRKKYGTKP